MKKKSPFLFLFLSIALGIQAQPSSGAAPALSPADAVRIALENNYEIRIARADAAIADANNTKANAGMLPAVNFVANENFTLSAFQQKLANGNEFNALGAPFNAANAAVQLNWTLFDGGRMYITKQKLEELEQLGRINLLNQVQQTSAAVLQAYYRIVQSQMQEKALAEVIALNEERLRIAEARVAAGFAAQTDVLTAKIDLHQRQSDLLTQRNLTATAKRNLNLLLVRAPDTPFEVETLEASTFNPDRETLLNQIQTQNPAILALNKTAEVATLTARENQTLNKPRIAGIGQFSAQRTDNGAGFLLNNTQAGLTLGASLTVPIYNGGNNKRIAEVAQIQSEQSRMRAEAELLQLQSELDNQIALFLTQKQILELETANVADARESLNISTERFRLGQTNSLEVQSAQNSLEQALLRRNIATYNLKIAEIQLRLMAGAI